jgi:1,4-alpha-glucan branching enzyme
MKKFTYLFLLFGFIGFAQQQTVTYSVSPATFEETQSITITVNGSSINEAAWGVTNNALYYWGWSLDQNAVTQDAPTNGSWTSSNEANRFTYNAGNDTYTKTFVPSAFYNRTNIDKIGFLVKAKDGTGDKKSQDIIVNVGSFQVNLTAPLVNSTTIIASGASLTITATNTGGAAGYVLKSNGAIINSNTSTSSYSYTHTNITGNQNYELTVTKGTTVITKKFTVIVNPGTVTAALPAGLKDGINYSTDATRATLVLNAPGKDFVYVAGSFNGWQPTAADAMKKDGTKFWLEVTNLTPGQVYTYQYWVVDQTPLGNSQALVKTADPFSTLVLSPYDDEYISEATYPNRPRYPAGQDFEVTVLQTNQQAYNWQATDFVKPAKEDLIIYETLIRDFTSDKTWNGLAAKIDYFKNLNINAIQLMPVMEFEGNISWGYNTAFHMASDKAYGTQDSMKAFIDLCHQNGIAVILDVALNHVYGRSPLARMWAEDPDGDGYGNATAENPYCNVEARHAYSVGTDLNHQQPLTQYYVERTIEHWMNEFHIDGFRWDLTKGFTQNCTPSDQTCTNAYQADRVAILKQYADYQWAIDPDFYVIFEHLGTGGSATEETEWANYKVGEGKGIMLWGNLNYAYNQNTMGYASDSNFNSIDFENRGFAAPRLVGYAESHDEERPMYKNKLYGNSNNPAHNVKNLEVALARTKALGAVFLTVPGPKMIWQFAELGYDFGINRCEDNTYDNGCRTNPKPIPSEIGYTTDTNRMAVYDTWAQINKLKLSNPVFHTTTFTVASGNLTPRIDIWNNSLASTELKYVIVLANFDVTAKTVNTNFPANVATTWYNLIDRTTMSNSATTITLQPGEFRILGNQPQALGTEDFTTQKVSLYPNPAASQFALNIAVSKVDIYSVTGQLIKTFTAGDADALYNVSDLSKGIYLVRIADVNNRQSTMKLIKE